MKLPKKYEKVKNDGIKVEVLNKSDEKLEYAIEKNQSTLTISLYQTERKSMEETKTIMFALTYEEDKTTDLPGNDKVNTQESPKNKIGEAVVNTKDYSDNKGIKSVTKSSDEEEKDLDYEVKVKIEVDKEGKISKI